MRSFIAILATLSLCQARPQLRSGAPSVSFVRNVEPYVIGGSNAGIGEFPWQLSQQRNSGSWSHSCGATLLSARSALSASHCVDGVLFGSTTYDGGKHKSKLLFGQQCLKTTDRCDIISYSKLANNMRVIAGLWDQTGTAGSVTADVSSYTMHADYGTGLASYSNDIAILNLASAINAGGNIGYATLPANNNNNYAGTTCVISGWGRTDGTNNLPNILQKASLPVITTNQCSNAMSGVGGANIWDNHICVQDPSGNSGACNGDSGGPLNCPDGGTKVAGVTSWVVSSGTGNCLPSYPSVYTRVSAYLGWIGDNSL